MEVSTRHVRHLTQNTPKDRSNFSPIFSRDGKFVVYSQANASASKTLTSSLLDLATGKATKLTPHEGEQTYFASDLSPDGKTILITSNAKNGYDNIGLLDIATQKIDWLTNDKWEINAGSFSPDGSALTWTANVEGNTNLYVYDIAAKHAEAAAAERGREFVGRQSYALLARWIEAALLPQRPDRSQ